MTLWRDAIVRDNSGEISAGEIKKMEGNPHGCMVDLEPEDALELLYVCVVILHERRTGCK